MKTRNLLCAALALLFPSSLALAGGGIANSAHDWTTESWNIQDKNVCGPCHMAHSSGSDQAIPLWSHQSTDPGRFTKLFSSPTIVSAGITIRTPDGSSKACLSCHDGTIAYNQIAGQTVGGTANAQFVRGDYVKGGGGDLSGDHPISFSYVDAYSKLGTNSLRAPTDVLNTTLPLNNNLRNQTISAAFLTSGDLQCNSCHDVHRQRGDSGLSSDRPLSTTPHNPLLVVYGVAADGLGSALCRSCHNK
jgi:hypothetical protein